MNPAPTPAPPSAVTAPADGKIPAAQEAEMRSRLEACGKELDALLTRHRCQIQANPPKLVAMQVGDVGVQVVPSEPPTWSLMVLA